MFQKVAAVLWAAIFVLTGSLSLGNTASAVGNDLVVNGISTIHFISSIRNVSPAQRALRAVERLKALPYWGEIEVGEDGENRTILIGQETIFAVTPKDAEAAQIPISTLVHAWAAKLQDALNLPPLRVSDNYARLPVGKSQLISVSGTESQLASASVADPKIARATKSGRGFLIEALSVGSTIVSIAAAKSQENVSVTVMPYAVQLPQALTAMVMGGPASADVVRGVADYAIKTKLLELADAQVTYDPVVFKPLAAGQSEVYSFVIKGTSPSGIGSKGIATVKVSNVASTRVPADFLWYSNSPETVKQAQSLFSATLKSKSNVRLLYHHMNGTMQDIYLRVEAVNESKIPATVSIIYGDAKPALDPVRAGFAAGKQFLRNWVDWSGDIVTIPPGAVLPISLRRLSPGETASGLCQLQLVDGPPDLLVRTDSLPPLRLDDKWANTIFTSTPWHEVGTHLINDYDNIPCEANPHVYANPHEENSLEYVVGGRHGYYRIGQQPLSQVNEEGSLDGNFGVFDDIQTKISNPNTFAADVEVVFEASAGYAGGLFLINGQIISTGLLRPKGTQRIAKVHLEAGAVRTFKILTFPISGGSYPATLFIRPILSGK